MTTLLFLLVLGGQVHPTSAMSARCAEEGVWLQGVWGTAHVSSKGKLLGRTSPHIQAEAFGTPRNTIWLHKSKVWWKGVERSLPADARFALLLGEEVWVAGDGLWRIGEHSITALPAPKVGKLFHLQKAKHGIVAVGERGIAFVSPNAKAQRSHLWPKNAKYKNILSISSAADGSVWILWEEALIRCTANGCMQKQVESPMAMRSFASVGQSQFLLGQAQGVTLYRLENQSFQSFAQAPGILHLCHSQGKLIQVAEGGVIASGITRSRAAILQAGLSSLRDPTKALPFLQSQHPAPWATEFLQAIAVGANTSQQRLAALRSLPLLPFRAAHFILSTSIRSSYLPVQEEGLSLFWRSAADKSRCLPFLRRIVRSRQKEIAFHAREMLLRIAPLEALEGASSAFRLQVTDKLLQMAQDGNEEAYDALLMGLRDPDIDIQAAAAGALLHY